MNTQPQFSNLYNIREYFSNETICREHLEKLLWNGKPVCPYCTHDVVYRFADGKNFKCASCREKFTVKTGTIFEGSHIPLSKWFIAMYLITSHKKGISSLQLGREFSEAGRFNYALSQCGERLTYKNLIANK